MTMMMIVMMMMMVMMRHAGRQNVEDHCHCHNDHRHQQVAVAAARRSREGRALGTVRVYTDDYNNHIHFHVDEGDHQPAAHPMGQ